MTFHDTDPPLLVAAMLAEEGPQVLIGDAHRPAKPVRNQQSSIDPAPDRPGTDAQQLGDLRDGEEFWDNAGRAPAGTSTVAG